MSWPIMAQRNPAQRTTISACCDATSAGSPPRTPWHSKSPPGVRHQIPRYSTQLSLTRPTASYRIQTLNAVGWRTAAQLLIVLFVGAGVSIHYLPQGPANTPAPSPISANTVVTADRLMVSEGGSRIDVVLRV